MLKKILLKENIQDLISECFLNKFSEFEKKVAQFFSTFKYDDNNNHNFDFHLDNYNFNHNNFQINNDIINNNNYADNLPSRSQVYNYEGNDDNNSYPNI